MMYFNHCTTLEELKAEYKKLVFKHHPDRGGNTAIMQEINNQYENTFAKLKNTHRNATGETYQKETNEAPADFINLINELLKMPGITIEVIGCFIWISGDTKPNKEALKALGFKWSKSKSMWYKAPEDYHKKSKGETSMDKIRDMYGVQYEATTNNPGWLTA